MNISDIDPKKLKKWSILATFGSLALFLVITFFSSYYRYTTKGPLSEEPVLYDEESFSRLHEELLKDKPETQETRELLQDIVKSTNKNSRMVSASRGVDDLYTKGSFDTLAVNCGVLLDKYRELVLKYHELKKQVETGKPVKSRPAKRRSAARLASKSSSSQSANGSKNNFDYTKYIRASTKNELSNEGLGSGLVSNQQFVWATLTLSQKQNVFDQSSVEFIVAEEFELDGLRIPHLARVEGIARVSRGRGRVFIKMKEINTLEQTIFIDGEVYSLDRSRGVNVFLRGDNAFAEGIKREATDLIGLLDPSRSGVGRTIIRDTDVGREVFGEIKAGTMVLAKLRRR